MKKIAAIIILSSLPYNAFANCAKQKEVNALDFKAIQSSMMVAALSCDQQKQYNKFMNKYGKLLSNGSGNVRSYFKRVYGKNYESKMNSFVTGLANKATNLSMSGEPESYCNESQTAFEELLKIKNNEISKFTERKKYSSLHGVNACS